MSATLEATERIAALAPAELFVDGVWRPAADGATFEVEDPSSGEPIATVADAGPADGLYALGVADRVQPVWEQASPRDRADVLLRAWELVRGRREELAWLITTEMGKALADARAEVDYAADFLRWFAEEAPRIAGRWQPAPTGSGRTLLVTRRAVGPCLLVTPWNFPLAMGARKVGPAIAAGCTSILKPAQQTPLSSLALAAILAEAGLPAGVLNVIPTSRAAPVATPLMRDERLRKISFTGSTAVGRLLVRQSAERLLRTSMELGGNAPFLVLEDADLDAAVDGAMLAKMRNGGQACTAANRFLVHRAVHDPFVERLAARMAALRVGPGIGGADVGPLIDAVQVAKVRSLVEEAVARGARVVIGGDEPDLPGHYCAPTVLTGVPADAALLHEEIFGPIAPVVAFDTEDEAVRLANATEYGLVAYVYSADLARALRVMGRLDTGMVGVNQGIVSNAAAPFGGVKASGMGREGGAEGIEEYLETQYAAFELGVGPCST